MEHLLLHTDPRQRAQVHVKDGLWLPSPMPGVSRLPLHRSGAESAQATTLVRYAPGSHFSPHMHEGGEEFIVLEGTFRDEHGAYPAGTYVRNPPGSRHAPSAPQGCLLFVKLRQFDPLDRAASRHFIGSGPFTMPQACAGLSQELLHEDARERVTVETWSPGLWRLIDLPEGGELLMLDGEVAEPGGLLRRHDWLRLPPGSQLQARAGAHGARLWLKQGHLSVLASGPGLPTFPQAKP